MFGIVSMLALSGCDGFATPKSDAIISTNDRCYILHGYTILQETETNMIWWYKPIKWIASKRKNTFSFVGKYYAIESQTGESFTQKEFIQNAKLIGIDDISKCVEMN